MIALPFYSFSQTSDANQKEEKLPLNTGYVTIGGGYGITALFGDIGTNSNVSFTNRFKTGFTGSIEKRFGRVVGVGLNAIIGKMAENERTVERQLNFQTDFQQFGAYVTANFDMDGSTHFAPFISAGVSYMMFESFTDSLGAQGTPYYYWSNGAVMDLPEYDDNGDVNQQNIIDANDYPRDYVYETRLDKSFDNSKSTYDRSTLVFPVTLGFKFKMFEFLETRLSGTYNITQSDFLDNYKEGGNDNYLYAGVSMHYTIGKKYVDPREKHYEDVDFVSIIEQDGDADGVPDINDHCLHTRKGVPVDEKGCALDDDGDGVPNYLDKEPNTSRAFVVKGAVDREGRGLTDEQIAIMDQKRKGIYEDRKKKFYEAPSLDMLEEFDIPVEGHKAGASSMALPDRFKFADVNTDGILQSHEITGAIDMFFTGEVDISVADIMEMIDFFFEQF